MASPNHPISPKEKIIIGLIFALGLFLRLFHLDFGLPRLYLVDEEFFVQPALRVADGTLNPGWFGAPAQPLIYGLGLVFRLVSFAINSWQNTALPVSVNYLENITVFQTIGRVLPALAGGLIIVFVYLIGRYWNKRTGYISAILVATSFYLTEHSHVIRPDIIQTLFLIMTLYFCLRIMDDHQRRGWYFGAGISFGLALTMKYPSLFFIIPLLIAILFLIWSNQFKIKKWLIFVVSSMLAAFVSAPFLFIKFRTAFEHLQKENAAIHGIASGNFIDNLWFYVSDVFSWGVGTFIYLLAIMAMVYLFVKMFQRNLDSGHKKMMVIVIAALSYLLFISLLNLHWARWVIPVITLLFILSGMAIDFILSLAKNKLVFVLLIIIFMAAPLLRLTRTLYGLSHQYTAEQARTWILKNIPPQSAIVVEPYAPELPKTKYKILKKPNLGYHFDDYYKNLGYSYFIINENVFGVIEQDFKEKGTSSPFWEKGYTRYQRLFAVSDLIYEIQPHQIYTRDELIYNNDIAALKSLRIDLLMGPYLRLYKFR